MHDECEINNEALIRQVVSFEGIKRIRNIRPTDIDGLIEYGGKVFIYFECKHADSYDKNGIPRGQRSAMEHIINSHIKAGHKAVAFLTIHQTYFHENIIAKNTRVVEYYDGGNWHKPKNNELTLIGAIEIFEKNCVNNGIRL